MRDRAWIAVLMAWIAGGVDATGYLGLGHLFTAHMSGNTAAFAASSGARMWQEGARRFVPIPVFVAGIFCGAVFAGVDETGRGAAMPKRSFALELVHLVICATALWNAPDLNTADPRYWAVTIVLAFAMGLQNTTVRRIGKTGVRTTYISGMLTDFAESAAEVYLWARRRMRGRGVRGLRRTARVAVKQEAFATMSLTGGIWLGFFVGAAMAGFAESEWRWKALVLPIAGLVLLCATNLDSAAEA